MRCPDLGKLPESRGTNKAVNHAIGISAMKEMTMGNISLETVVSKDQRERERKRDRTK